MTNAIAKVKKEATKKNVIKKEAIKGKAKGKKEEKKAFSFSQFTNEYNKKSDKLSLSVVRMEKGKTTAEKFSTSFSVRPFLPLFEKLKRITDGKTKRKEALKSVKSYVLALKSESPRAHVLRPIIETIKENFGKDFSSLLQESFRR